MNYVLKKTWLHSPAAPAGL